MDVVNVAQGALIILAAFFAWSLWKDAGIDPLLGVVITTPAMFLLGFVMYKLTVQWISGMPSSMSVLLTFALALVIEGSMGLAWSTTYHAATPGYFDESYRAGGYYFPKGQVYGCAVAIGVLVLLYLMLNRTWLGRAIRALSENVQSARLVGVNVRGVAALTFAIGVATAGAGGSIVSVLYPFLPGSHYQWIARLLAIRSGDGVFILRRILEYAGRPAVLDEITLPASLFAGMTRARYAAYPGSMYGFFETEFGVRMLRAEERLHAVAAEGASAGTMDNIVWNGPQAAITVPSPSSPSAGMLQVPTGTPLLAVDRVSFTYGDRPVEVRRGLCTTVREHYWNTLT